MNVKKIYFDLDGVFADFDRAIAEILNLPVIGQAKSTPAEHDRLFAAIKQTEHYYDRLELMPNSLELFQTVYKQYGDCCEILSGIPKPHRGITTAREDKIAWVRRNLSQDIKINLVYRQEKKLFCTGCDCILIDDYITNIKEWRKHGGTAILHTDAKTTLKELKKLGIL